MPKRKDVKESSEYAYERLRSNLERLKMNEILEVLDGIMEQAIRDKKSVVEILDELFDAERRRKEETSRKMRLNLAGFPMIKRLDDFDFEFQPSIPEELVRDLATLRFIHNKENLLLLGPPGVGKSHLAISLGFEAIYAGMTVYFTTAATMIDKLRNAALKGNFESKLKTFCKHKLLIIDELGYLPLEKEGSHLFFQVISRLYEKGSIIITSNKSFGDWGDVFGDHVVAAAVLDRLLHHAAVINIRGESYRLRERSKMANPLRTSMELMKNVDE